MSKAGHALFYVILAVGLLLTSTTLALFYKWRSFEVAIEDIYVDSEGQLIVKICDAPPIHAAVRYGYIVSKSANKVSVFKDRSYLSMSSGSGRDLSQNRELSISAAEFIPEKWYEISSNVGSLTVTRGRVKLTNGALTVQMVK